MIYSISDPKVQQFIASNLHADINQLLLKYRDVHGIPTSFIVDQISGRLKAKGKFARLLEDPELIFPPAINLEQSSSQTTAQYKAQYLKGLLTTAGKPERGVDLTGGFGIDTLFLSELFQNYHYVEANSGIFEIAKYNLARLQPKLEFHNTTAEQYLQETRHHFTLAYIDPSRRNELKQKVVGLSDCIPDIITLQEKVWEKSEWLVVKASPLLDIDLGARQLMHVKDVLVIAVENEVREVNFICQKNFEGDHCITAVDLTSNRDHIFQFTRFEEQTAVLSHGDVESFLYESNAAIRKAGAFRIIAEKFALNKLHPNTHLYSGKTLINDFPGRVFKVISKVKSDPKLVGKLVDGQANVMTKNYPLTPEALKKKMKINDGGDKFLIGFTGPEGPQLVVAERISTKGGV